MKKTEAAGGVVVHRSGRVLVVSQNGNSWSLPKGHVDPGEKTFDAAKREIYEESGVTDLKFVAALGSYERYRIGKDGGEDQTELKLITFYHFTTGQYDLAPVDPKNPVARWVDKKDVAALLTHPKDAEFFRGIEKLL
jgi:8-oxo-dGTP pyrophosphatase MutT (NUDIX family)